MSEPFNFKLDSFDGPLDLLLHLIDSEKIDLYNIPISRIVVQFRQYMTELDHQDLDSLTDFIVMAAELMSIKSRMLLPKEKDPDTGKEIDPRADLVNRLIAYKKIKLVSGRLRELYEANNGTYVRDPEDIPYEQKYTADDFNEAFKGVTMKTLLEIYSDVLERSRDRLDTRRMGFSTIKKETFSVKGKIKTLLAFAKTHRDFSFREIIENSDSKAEYVVSFLSLLELAKSGKIHLIQKEKGENIQIEVVETAEFSESDLSILEDFK